MMPSFPTLSVPLISAISLMGTTYARTTLEGCTFTETVSERDEYSIVWYAPETGEICDVPVCGGGLDPFDYDNPACPEYTGTAPYKPSYLEDYGPWPTTVRAETAVDAAVTSAADWTEEEEGEADNDVNPGDDEFRSTTITSTRFSSTVATSSTEKARSTSISIIPSSRASLRPSPTSTSSAAVFASERAHDSTSMIRTSPAASSLPRPLFSGLVASNATAEPMADHQPCGSTFADHLFLGSVSDVAGTSATSTTTTGTFTTSNPKTKTPKVGTPRVGTPRVGTPRVGTPRNWHLQNWHLQNWHLQNWHVLSQHLLSQHLFNQHLLSQNLLNQHLLNQHLLNQHLLNQHLFNQHLLNQHLQQPALSIMVGRLP
ncbi:hypothetical protein BDW72DRAFT_196810 [Aspergillus terricola var. indicus]